MKKRMITDDMKDKIVKMDDVMHKQFLYLKIAEPKIVEWAHLNNAKIFKFYSTPHFCESSDIFIFYKTEVELTAHTESGVVEKTKDQLMRILNEIGYIAEFNDNVRFEFDSDENVKKNFRGNYFFRLR